jgi:hypothetical protein
VCVTTKQCTISYSSCQCTLYTANNECIHNRAKYLYPIHQLIILLCTGYIFRLQYKGHLDIRFYIILLCTGCILIFQYICVLEYLYSCFNSVLGTLMTLVTSCVQGTQYRILLQIMSWFIRYLQVLLCTLYTTQ